MNKINRKNKIILQMGIVVSLIMFITGTKIVAKENVFSNLGLSESENAVFDENIGTSQDMINEIVKYANENGKIVNGEDISPDGNLKIYTIRSEFVEKKGVNGFANYLLDDYYNKYDGKIKNAIKEKYSLIKPYVDKEGNIVGSLYFERTGENDTDFTFVCLGNLIMNDKMLSVIKNSENLEKMIRDLGVKSPKDIKLIDGLGLGVFEDIGFSVYFTDYKDKEYLIPLQDVCDYDDGFINEENARVVIEKFKVYEMKTIVEDFLVKCGEEEDRIYEKHKDSKEILFGPGSSIPKGLEKVKYIEYKESPLSLSLSLNKRLTIKSSKIRF